MEGFNGPPFLYFATTAALVGGQALLNGLQRRG